MHDLAISEREKATAWLLTGAIFFAMRSCEYLRTASESTKRTKVLRVGNITFKKGSSVIPHDHPHLHNSDLVRIRFEFQKNDKRDVYIHMFRSGDDTLCPVIAWANTVRRVLKIPGATVDSHVCSFFDKNTNKVSLITAEYTRSRLRAMVVIIGEDILGFKASEIGLHSLRSGGAMAMFLSGTSVVVIMRVGRWSSEAFLEYIRDQVESFTLGVSSNMLKYETFLNLATPEISSTANHNPTKTSSEGNISEDGPDSNPIIVNFSKLALNGSAPGIE